ncbi:VanZ family protein [Romboutsia sp. Marseille-P6047]|uniref:VanZ family protein n=1 Tax=Romboutsia sp. Marseille-P6047 TaxID=2161817 RepID=UPI0013DDAAF2|nr:VanZ family protein [Romboutsia sp. Marseille-P6047]
MDQYIWTGIWILTSNIVIALKMYLVFLSILWITKKRKIFKLMQSIFEVMLLTYTITLLKITGIIGMKFYFSYVMNGMYNMNLIPFKDVSIMMLFLNFLLFLPYGFLLPCVFKKLRVNGKKILIIGFTTSFSIELLQLFGGRFAEIDDILINSLGAYTGFIIFSYISKIISYRKDGEHILIEKS